MHSFTIPDLNKEYSFPEFQEEMTGPERIIFIELVLQHFNNEFDFEELKRRLLMKFLDIKITVRYRKLLPEPVKLLINDNFNRLAELLNSLFPIEIIEGKEVINLNVTIPKQFLPVLVCGHKKYYGPEDALSDCTFFEYRTGVYWYKQYVETKEENALNHLIALLYRKQKTFYFIKKKLASYSGIRRRNINSKTNPLLLDARAKKLGKLPYPVKYTIFLYFAGCVEYLFNGEPEIDGHKINLKALYEGAENAEKGIGLNGLLFQLAETKVFGSLDEVDNQNLYTIMSRLYQVKKMADEIKAKNKTKTND